MKNLVEIDLDQHEIYQPKVWGNTEQIAQAVGRDVSKFGEETIGEVFVASNHRDGKSHFKDGRDFDTAIESDQAIFGSAVGSKKSFPILLKILSANQPLSIQTHYKNKIEAWVTLSEGEIFYGLTPRGEEVVQTQEGRDAFFDILSTSSDKKELAQYFNHVKFSADEAFIVHAGVAHALLGGTVFEPQKNANLTMRAGDWGRNMPNRPLHKEDFFASLYPFASDPKPIEKMYKIKEDGVSHACRFVLKDVALDEIIVDGGSRTIETFDDRFFIGFIMDGEIELTSADETREFSKGQAFVMCARPAQWTFSGKGRVFLTYVPHITKGIIEPLYAHGYSYEQIARIGGNILKENDVYVQMLEEGIL